METIVIGFDYGLDHNDNIIPFASLKTGDKVNFTVRDQHGWQTGCEEVNFRIICGIISEVIEVSEGSPSELGEWKIIYTKASI